MLQFNPLFIKPLEVKKLDGKGCAKDINYLLNYYGFLQIAIVIDSYPGPQIRLGNKLLIKPIGPEKTLMDRLSPYLIGGFLKYAIPKEDNAKT